MNLEEKVQADMKAAMLAKDQPKLEAIRAIKSVLLLLKTSPDGLTEESAIKALQKEVKKRKETAELYVSQARQDLADVEVFQAGVIESYLPKQMGEAELRDALKVLISEVGASGPGDMGKVMGAATKKFAGIADGKLISVIVKEILSS
ncbi:MAG: GatB/YqeY domain-containing protein [Bacteroidetes bacterium]|jgi:uncharacterized protein YqeY|nr:GatB/YqeY domain-containing protein [Bacteroidota bacterium]